LKNIQINLSKGDSNYRLLYDLPPFFRVFFLKNGGRSTATSSQSMRPEGADTLVSETVYDPEVTWNNF